MQFKQFDKPFSLTRRLRTTRLVLGAAALFFPLCSWAASPSSPGSIPEPPSSLRGTIYDSHKAFTLSWSAPAHYSDGTPAGDIRGFNVYRRASLKGPIVRLNSSPVTMTVFADKYTGGRLFYFVRTVGKDGQESKASNTVDTGTAYSRGPVPAEIDPVTRRTMSRTILPADPSKLADAGF